MVECPPRRVNSPGGPAEPPGRAVFISRTGGPLDRGPAYLGRHGCFLVGSAPRAGRRRAGAVGASAPTAQPVLRRAGNADPAPRRRDVDRDCPRSPLKVVWDEAIARAVTSIELQHLIDRSEPGKALAVDGALGGVDRRLVQPASQPRRRPSAGACSRRCRGTWSRRPPSWTWPSSFGTSSARTPASTGRTRARTSWPEASPRLRRAPGDPQPRPGPRDDPGHAPGCAALWTALELVALRYALRTLAPAGRDVDLRPGLPTGAAAAP